MVMLKQYDCHQILKSKNNWSVSKSRTSAVASGPESDLGKDFKSLNYRPIISCKCNDVVDSYVQNPGAN